MIIVRGLPKQGLPADPVVTVGMFDGVHLGHRALIRKTCGWASEIDGVSTVLTFSGRPANRKEYAPLIASLDRRLVLIEKSGADVCVVLEFSEDIVSMTPDDFLDEIILGSLNCRRIVAGFNWKFGRDREGGKELLLEREKEGKIQVRFEEPVMYRGEIVSSTAVREAVACGDLEQAAGLLGRPFSITGEVIRGTGRGAGLKFPTANLNIEELVRPPTGVYAAKTIIDGEEFSSAASLGTRPTFGEGPFTVEVHVIGFSGDLYGKTIEVGFVRFLRPEKNFSSEKELCEQMKKDVEEVERRD